MNFSKYKYSILILILVFAALITWQKRSYFNGMPWVTDLHYSYPEYAVADTKNQLYVIDQSKRRVTRINANNQSSLILKGGEKKPNSFFYALDLAVDSKGHIFLLNHVMDDRGFNLIREEIQEYDSQGQFIGLIYQQNYSEADHKPTLVQRGKITGLTYYQDRLHWYVVDERGIQPFSLANSNSITEVESGLFYPLKGADYLIADLHPISLESFVYSNKNGSIHQTSFAVDGMYWTEQRYQAPAQAFSIAPWGVAVNKQQTIFTLDLLNQSIHPLDNHQLNSAFFSGNQLQASRPETAFFNYYHFSIAPDNSLITTNDEAVIQWSQSGLERYLTLVPYDAQLLQSHWLAWVSCLVFVVALSRLLFFGVQLLIQHSGQVFYLSIATIAAVSISAFVVSNMIIPHLTKQYEQVLVEKLSYMLQTSPRLVDAELFDQLQGLDDFQGEAYQKIYASFLEGLNYNQDTWNESSYFAIYRIINNRLYGLMYLNGSIGMMHPFDWLGDDSVYEKAQRGLIATEMTHDISGEWLYGVSPVKNKAGEVVALFETGTDLYAFRLASQKLIKDLALQVITILVILVLVMMEMIFLYQILKQRFNFVTDKVAISKVGDFSDVQLARPLNFIFFTAVSMSLAFIPLMMSGFYEPVTGLSKDFLLALPISIELFFFGFATLISGYLVPSLGWRRLFVIGLLVVLVGLVFSGLAWDMSSFCVARAFTGLGSGISYIGLRALINQESRQQARSEGYSHFYAGMIAGGNVGVVLGASLADLLGFSQVFYVAASILVLAFVFYFYGLKRLVYIQPVIKAAVEESSGIGLTKKVEVTKRSALTIYLRDPKIWLFFICLVFPTYLAGTFLAYYLPVFAEDQGLSIADIGRLFILNGLFIIYFGPPLSRFFKRRLGDFQTQMLGSALWAASLIIFAATGSLWGAVAALILMGITEGFCATAQNEYYLEMPSSKLLGEDKATGYFELFSKIGETLGPIGFSIALLLGQQLGILVLGLLVLFATLPALLFLKETSASSNTPSKVSIL